MKFIVYPISALIIGISIIVGASILKGTFFTNQNDSTVKNSSTLISTVNSPNIMTKNNLLNIFKLTKKQLIALLMKIVNKKLQLVTLMKRICFFLI